MRGSFIMSHDLSWVKHWTYFELNLPVPGLKLVPWSLLKGCLLHVCVFFKTLVLMWMMLLWHYVVRTLYLGFFYQERPRPGKNDFINELGWVLWIKLCLVYCYHFQKGSQFQGGHLQLQSGYILLGKDCQQGSSRHVCPHGLSSLAGSKSAPDSWCLLPGLSSKCF